MASVPHAWVFLRLQLCFRFVLLKKILLLLIMFHIGSVFL